MTNEIDEILEKYHHGQYDLIEVRKFFLIAHQQQLSAERERAAKLVEALEFVLAALPVDNFLYTKLKVRNAIFAYQSPETTGNKTAG